MVWFSFKIIFFRSFSFQVPTKCEMNIHQSNIHAGSNIELSCQINSLKSKTIQWHWYHNSMPLSNKSNRYIITNATRKHMGMYQCCFLSFSSDLNSCCAQTQIRIISKKIEQLY